jgi:protein-L-isoaspartate(D-aspartate) O-methyltransferase
VRVDTGDAGLGVPENAPYDRAVITIGSLDVPPAWFGQLRPGGRLVVPLRWRGQTQSVALVLGEDGILRSVTPWALATAERNGARLVTDMSTGPEEAR